MDISRLPLPDIQDDVFQYSFKRAPHRRGQRRPPKLNHDANFNRSHNQSSMSNVALAISFCTVDGNSQMAMTTSETLGFEESFTALEKIGEGSFGEVFKVRSKTDGCMYAVKMSKQLFRSEHYRQEQLEEARRCEQFSGHENCVRFYRAWEQDDRLYMQMELCRESLDQYLERRHHIPEEKIWSILLDLLLALKSLHDRNLIHLDIKLDNVLVGDDDSCKLADFGLVIDVDRANQHQATEGDSRYMAPEIMQGKFSKAADIFSLGIAMLELSCYLELPSNGPLWQQLRSGVLPEEFIRNISPTLSNVIKQMMSPNASDRPTVDQLLGHKKIVDLQYRRKRWRILKSIKKNILKSQRYARSICCQLKNVILRNIAFILTCLVSNWRSKDSIESKSMRTSNMLNGRIETMYQNGNLFNANGNAKCTPKVLVISSTPTSGDYCRQRNNRNVLGESSTSLLDLSGHDTPSNISINNMANSTPLNRYDTPLRIRKDLTKTSFKIATCDVLAEPNGTFVDTSSGGSILRLEDIENESSLFIRKPFETSSLIGKKLFNDFSTSDDSN